MSQPLVSVAMASWNCEAYIAEAIESILVQTYPHFELLIADDMSSDRSLEIAREYAARDPRIRCWPNSERLGDPGNRNLLIREARGELIAVQDGDDVALPRRLEATVAALAQEPTLAAVATGALEIDEDGDLLGERCLSDMDPEQVRRALWEACCFVHSSALFRAGALREVGGYDEFFQKASDYDLWLRLAARHDLRRLGEPMVKYRIRTTSTSLARPGGQRLYTALALERAHRAARGQVTDLREALERLRAAQPHRGRSQACPLHIMAHCQVRAGNRLKARRYFRESLRRSGRTAQALTEYLLTFLPAAMDRSLRAFVRRARSLSD